jgi:LacI family transcriptional regulator
VKQKLEDIARIAGVNPATVSRAINKPEKVKLETRQKIQAIINELGYKPNYFAKGLMTGKTDSVGILTVNRSNPYFEEIIEGIERLLVPDGTYLYLCNCECSLDLEKRNLEEMIRRNIDALFVIETPSLNSKNNFYVNRKFHCPVILINQHVKASGGNFVLRCDQQPGLLEVFTEVERRSLYPFMLFIPAMESYTYALKIRFLEKWRRENHIPEAQVSCIKVPDITEPNNEKSVWSSFDITKRILSSPARPRAILAANDLMALGILAAARELKIKVPEELSIAGVDNTFISRISIPPLSTIDLRTGDVGAKAAELYQRIKKEPDKNHPKILVLPSRFNRRGTF